jgi:hypothetical protein
MPAERPRLDVNPQLECAQTLASRFYTDPAILALERGHIFPRTWQLVGTLNQPCGEANGAKRTIIAFCINNGIIGTGGKRLCPDQKETLIYWKIGASGLWPC